MKVCTGVDKHGFRRKALFSNDGKHRYRLIIDMRPRLISLEKKQMMIIMLNPSMANHVKNDPTVRRMIGFALRDGFNVLDVHNLYTIISSKPKILINSKKKVVGLPWKSQLVKGLQQAHFVIVGWGHQTFAFDRIEEVLNVIKDNYSRPIFCLGMTNLGDPRHPLYISGDQPFVEYKIT